MIHDLLVPQSGTNAFGAKIYNLAQLFSDTRVESCIRSGLLMKFDGIGLTDEKRKNIVEKIISVSKKATDLLQYEKETNAYLKTEGVIDGLSSKITGRAELMAKLLVPFGVGRSVLDLGCGPGEVGFFFSKAGYAVTLADVYKNENVEKYQLPFVLMTQNDDFPFDNASFDNVLILAMLHHTEDPLHTIEETKRILKPGGRLHLIETVFGVNVENSSAAISDQDRIFASLTQEQQRMATMFFDYFGNHVTWYYTDDPKKYVPVPFNFNTPSFWEEKFSVKGFRAIEKRPIGVDRGSGVYHFLFVLELYD